MLINTDDSLITIDKQKINGSPELVKKEYGSLKGSYKVRGEREDCELIGIGI
jgi:hypothetical protein